MILAELTVEAYLFEEDESMPYERIDFFTYDTVEEAKKDSISGHNYRVKGVRLFLIPEAPIESWTNE